MTPPPPTSKSRGSHMTESVQEGDQLAKESAPGALGCSGRLAFIWAHLAVATRPGRSLTTSCGLRPKPLLSAICSHVCPKESGGLTVTQRPRVCFPITGTGLSI